MTNKNYLTTEAYKEMASRILDVVEDLNLVKNTLEFIQHPKDMRAEADMTLEYFKVYKYTDSLFHKVQGLIKSLEHVSGALYSTDELDELKGYVDDKWLITDEKNTNKRSD